MGKEDDESYFEFGSSPYVRWLSKENVSIHDKDGKTIEDVTCYNCKKQVDARECTLLMGATTQEWVCKECHFGD